MDQPTAPDKAMLTAPHKSSTKKWVACIILPFALLIFTAIAQMLVRFAIGDSTETAGTADRISKLMNIFSVLVGIVAMIFLLLLPLWIILLIRDSKAQK